MSIAFLGLSHTPLLGLAQVDPRVEGELRAALAALREHVQAFAPERILLVGPDHYNGFVHQLMPVFCIGTEAESVGDYLTPAGPVNVDGTTAVDLARHLAAADFDIAVSRRMRVDHGFVQALQLLWGGLASPPVVPLFMNAVAQPNVPRIARCIALGEAIGRFLATSAHRWLVIGSGGLSHEPPVPTLEHPDPLVRERITVWQPMTDAQRRAKTERVVAAGRALAAGDPAMKPLNPAWDRRWMDAIERADFDHFRALDEAGIARDAGWSAHESKSWLVGRAAVPDPHMPTVMRHYQAIPELIAGFGILLLGAA